MQNIMLSKMFVFYVKFLARFYCLCSEKYEIARKSVVLFIKLLLEFLQFYRNRFAKAVLQKLTFNSGNRCRNYLRTIIKVMLYTELDRMHVTRKSL